MKIKTCEIIKPDFVQVEKYLGASYDAGQLSNGGPCLEMLGGRLHEALGASVTSTVLPVASGHVALMTAYAVLEIKRPLMPAYTFPSTYCAATLQGIQPQLVDVDLKSGCLEVDNIKDIPLDTYDSVVAVCGLSTIPNLEALEAFCRTNKKKLIIDGAATFGTSDVAKYGDAFCLSMHATKSLPVGEGGALVISTELYRKAKEYIEFGLDTNKQITMPGLNGKLNEYTAAIALSVLDQVGPYIRSRLLTHLYVRCTLPETFTFPVSSKGTDTVYQFAPVFVHTKEQAGRMRERLTEEQIPHLQYYKPLSMDFPNSASLYERNICLPIHSGIERKTIERVARVLSGF